MRTKLATDEIHRSSLPNFIVFDFMTCGIIFSRVHELHRLLYYGNENRVSQRKYQTVPAQATLGLPRPT